MSAAEGAGRGAPLAGSTAGAPSFPAGDVTEVRGPAQDVQAQLFGEGDPRRPAAQGFTSAREVAAAAEGARQSMSCGRSRVRCCSGTPPRCRAP